MTREQALQSILTGVRSVEEQKKAGVELLATGEMGIGNTTTSSAVPVSYTHLGRKDFWKRFRKSRISRYG